MIVMKPTATRGRDPAPSSTGSSPCGARAHPVAGDEVTVIGAIGDREHVARLELEGSAGRRPVVPILKPYKLACSAAQAGEPNACSRSAGGAIGGEHFALIAGPCTVESREQMLDRAPRSRQAGATMLRGGAYKPRTSPYAFQGLGEEGLRLLAEAASETGLPIVTELMDARDLEPVARGTPTCIQIGARNMQNFALLTEVGRSGKPGAAQARPVGDARGAAAWRPSTSSRRATRRSSSASAASAPSRPPRASRSTWPPCRCSRSSRHLPVIVDPSHAAGPARPRRAAVAAPRPRSAPTASSSRCTPTPRTRICDGPQALRAERLRRLRGARAGGGRGRPGKARLGRVDARR